MTTVRRATKADHATLVEFNRAMAWETEHKHLDSGTLSKGVAAVLEDPQKGFFLVAGDEGAVVGQLMVTTEWSDWRNGWFWWIQSVYVVPEKRRLGLLRSLYREVQRLSAQAGNVAGIRLYVERENTTAQQAYVQLGMDNSGYLVFEWLTPRP